MSDVRQHSFSVTTRGRGTYEITDRVQEFVRGAGIVTGLCHVFIHHTSAAVMLCENADPTVRQDLETWMARMIPDGDPSFRHQDEGPDDMAAHLRTLLTRNELSIPVSDGSCALGTWQGIYLWEHRHAAHQRRITVTVLGG